MTWRDNVTWQRDMNDVVPSAVVCTEWRASIAVCMSCQLTLHYQPQPAWCRTGWTNHHDWSQGTRVYIQHHRYLLKPRNTCLHTAPSLLTVINKQLITLDTWLFLGQINQMFVSRSGQSKLWPPIFLLHPKTNSCCICDNFSIGLQASLITMCVMD